MPEETEPEMTAAPAEAPEAQPAEASAEKTSANVEDAMAAIERLTATIEKMQRPTSAPDAGDRQSTEIIRRIERLENWVASNRMS